MTAQPASPTARLVPYFRRWYGSPKLKLRGLGRSDICLKQQALAAIDLLHADESVSRSETRDTLADLSNHIDDLMRAIDAEEDLREQLDKLRAMKAP